MPTDKKILFVCQANRLRSPTAEIICQGIPGLEAKSAGLSATAVNTVTREMVEWADVVFVMERRQRNRLHELIGDLYDTKRIICLYIPDEYEYMEPGLVSILKSRLTEHLGDVFKESKGHDSTKRG